MGIEARMRQLMYLWTIILAIPMVSLRGTCPVSVYLEIMVDFFFTLGDCGCLCAVHGVRVNWPKSTRMSIYIKSLLDAQACFEAKWELWDATAMYSVCRVMDGVLTARHARLTASFKTQPSWRISRCYVTWCLDERYITLDLFTSTCHNFSLFLFLMLLSHSSTCLALSLRFDRVSLPLNW